MGLPCEDRITSVFKSGCELLSESNRLIELADWQEPSIAGQGSVGDLDFDETMPQEIE
jgi:hypothetical protein